MGATVPPPPLSKLRRAREEEWEQLGLEPMPEICASETQSDVDSGGSALGDGTEMDDGRDTAEFIPVHEKQTNNRGELRAALWALQGRTPGKQTLICPDSLLVVDGALGKAQKWKRHQWVGSSGPVSHADLWEDILSILEVCGHEVHWLPHWN